VAVIIADYEQVHKIFLEGLKVLSMFLKTTSSQIKKFSTLLNECDHTLSEWYFNKETTMALASINIEQYLTLSALKRLRFYRAFLTILLTGRSDQRSIAALLSQVQALP